ncbi:MAG: hypothetical protein JW862_11365 [Anaerolineales bacterium]|nr:hypothetical protein [Anaerolineales bacterium]
MSFAGFNCEITAEPVAPADCLACARSGPLPGCPMTAPVIKGILDGLRPDDFGLTVTTLLGCARKSRLKKDFEYFSRPRELWWAYRGQLLHGVAAAYAASDLHAIAERRFTMVLEAGGAFVEISGQPDLVYTDTAVLIDYKTTKAVPGAWRTYTCPETQIVIREGAYGYRNKYLPCPHCPEGQHIAKEIVHEGPPRAYRTHIQQVSAYRLLMAENDVHIERALIVYQDMREQLPIEVTLLPLDETMALLQSRLEVFTAPNLPPVLTEPEEVWQCGYCPVRGACERIHGAPVGIIPD